MCVKSLTARAFYEIEAIRANVFASRYLTALPDAETLRREIQETKLAIQARDATGERDAGSHGLQ
jgi:hypothetical protein